MMAELQFPTVDDLLDELREIREQAQSIHDLDPRDESKWIDVRLQVCEDGEWNIYTGDTQHDDDHGGYWGFDTIGPRSDIKEIAEGLIEEAKDQYYVHGD